ncbi:MAG: hypothetical protein D4R64_13500 [Porphyromonadaceae bacterium]|nr:MAG: hypothetical protein D4R64_13500 [Porphyromonadaceae bacterium]
MAQSVINYPKTREILYPLFLVNFLFFMWGFIWNLNNLLIALGALIAGFGLLIFIPSALSLSFPLFLLGTFVVFSGVTFLQIACNPYVRALGVPGRAASRINLSQGLGAIGAFMAAYIAGGFILKLFADDPFHGITWFYLILGVLFISLAVLETIANMPANPTDGTNHGDAEAILTGGKHNAWGFRHFRIDVSGPDGRSFIGCRNPD